ncbi:MAG: hypothetical protein LBV49_10760 [Azonexus sp.]|nr:hypothetical protein [Azonexus sp.]
MRGDSVAAAFIARAADLAQSARRDKTQPATTRLLAATIALELSLKAVVLHQDGADESDLANATIDYDLSRAWVAALARGFQPAAELTGIVNRLSPYCRENALADLAGHIGFDELTRITVAIDDHVDAARRWMEAD